MTPNKPQLQQNAPFRAVNQPKGNPFLSLRAIPFLIVLAGSLAIQPAVGASPVVTTIAVTAPNEILGIVASPNRSQVYATDYLNNRVAVIDTVSNQIDFFITGLFDPPEGLGLSFDGNTLYVTEDPNVLEVISLTTSARFHVFLPANAFPQFPGVASNGSTVYVPDRAFGGVTPVGGPVGTKFIGGAPSQAVFTPNNATAYVTNETNFIARINTTTGAVNFVKTGNNNNLPTQGLAIEGSTLFATGINKVYRINTNTNTVVHTINVPHAQGAFNLLGFPALTPDGAFLYVPVEFNYAPPDNDGNTMVVINTLTNQIVQTFTVGQEPVQAAAAANGIYGYVTNYTDGTVTVFQLAHLPPGL